MEASAPAPANDFYEGSFDTGTGANNLSGEIENYLEHSSESIRWLRQEVLPTETQSFGQQADNMATDGTGGVSQVGWTQIGLNAEGFIVATSTSSAIPTTTGFPVVSAAFELRSFLSQPPQVLLSSTEIDRLCPLLMAAINAASTECERHPMRELLAEAYRLKEALATCSPSSRPETLPLQGYDNSVSAQFAVSISNLKAEITSLDDQAAQVEGRLKAIYERKAQTQPRALKISKTVARMSPLFEFLLNHVLPKP